MNERDLRQENIFTKTMQYAILVGNKYLIVCSVPILRMSAMGCTWVYMKGKDDNEA